jgi:hypothetical protein
MGVGPCEASWIRVPEPICPCSAIHARGDQLGGMQVPEVVSGSRPVGRSIRR